MDARQERIPLLRKNCRRIPQRNVSEVERSWIISRGHRGPLHQVGSPTQFYILLTFAQLLFLWTFHNKSVNTYTIVGRTETSEVDEGNRHEIETVSLNDFTRKSSP